MKTTSKQAALLNAFISTDLTIAEHTLKKPTAGTLALLESASELTQKGDLESLGVYVYIHTRPLREAHSAIKSDDDLWLYEFLDTLTTENITAFGKAITGHTDELEESATEIIKEKDNDADGGK